ncbi:hypothetical protein IHE45_09G039800 [Dioscorea alata]|uniref:Uncharacterized protein n=1 Tax=Dioscorea alata TaxID=55571 RepID=A0ACB7VEK1_DIOAL|nr:hypothetical protein IHE45_09G039800 [Dioscorea alata]
MNLPNLVFTSPKFGLQIFTRIFIHHPNLAINRRIFKHTLNRLHIISIRDLQILPSIVFKNHSIDRILFI